MSTEPKAPRRNGPFPMLGRRFGRLTVIQFAGYYESPKGRRARRFNALCDCGGQLTVVGTSLLSGNTQSCGCRKIEMFTKFATHHGEGAPDTLTKEYQTYRSMISRCENPNVKSYQNYGARGIYVSPEWKNSYLTFLHDMGRRPLGHTLDRIDVNGPYSKENCKWATPKEQGANKRKMRCIHNFSTEELVAELKRRSTL